MRTQLASSDSARIYGACVGAYNQYDARACAVPQFQLRAANALGAYDDVAAHGASAISISASGCDVGIVQDSGVAERCKNLYALGAETAVSAEATGKNERVIQVSYPIPVPPCNPWRGAPLPASCPYKNGPLAIPHFSAGGLDFLFEDFQRAFIRYLGTSCPSALDGIDAAGGGAAYTAARVGINAGGTLS